MTDKKCFSEAVLDRNPFIQFDVWYKEHLNSGIPIPDSVSLGTADSEGNASVRTVLLKAYDGDGFVFYTNYTSKKGVQLKSNPRAALLFYWPESGRQVRIEGITEKVSEKESQLYFNTRPRESQIGAWASDQSSVIPDRQYLLDKYEFLLNKFSNKLVEKPPTWGGFRLIPSWFEFWQNGEFRLHDRLTYTRKKETWVIERLAP
jgi:pyridoxamine 5'-phosphate oxidase